MIEKSEENPTKPSKRSKTIRRIKDRARQIRQDGMVSIARSLELASKEHGFRDYLHAQEEIFNQRKENASRNTDGEDLASLV